MVKIVTYKKYNILFLCLLSFNSIIFAQKNIDNLFDDGGLSLIKNLIKIGYDPVNGEIPILIEHKLLTNLSFEGGIGIVSFKKQNNLYKDDPIPGMHTSGYGINLSAGFRFYLFSEFFHGFYTSSGVKVNFFNKTYTDVDLISCGWQFPIKDKFAFDMSAGFGFKFFRAHENIGTIAENKDIESRWHYPIHLKFGYAF